VSIGGCLLAALCLGAAPDSAEQLLAKGKPDAAIAQAAKEMLNRPRDWQNVQKPLKVQARAYLAINKPQEALRCAKMVYNVSNMAETGDAVLLVYQCLQAAYPDDGGILDRFRAEQEAGAIAPADLSPASAKRSPVMDSIRLEGARFDEVIKKQADDYDGLLAKGNLLLISDRVKEARVVFEKVYEVAPPDRLGGATENLARCIKAEDGTIGRANAFVLSLRPKREAAQKK
jgi:tetratricopeptide (TPR) repeat protein